MNKFKIFTLLVVLAGFTIFAGCDDDEPQPVSLTFRAQSASKDGAAISPVPDYTLTLNFTADGAPDGYTAGGTAQFRPTPANSGTFAISGNTVTFTASAGGDSRTVQVQGGSISNTAINFSLAFTLTKTDDGVAFEDQGEYIYAMAR